MGVINLDINLQRENKVFKEDELLTGCVRFECSSEEKHDGISLTLEGVVNFQLSNTKSVGLIDAFYNSLKPIILLNSALELTPSGKLPSGKSEFHFEFPLVCQKKPRKLYETYHGVFININYQLRCDVKRSFLSKSLQKCQQFCVQYKPQQIDANVKLIKKEIPFTINYQRNVVAMPRFLITGKFESTEVCLTQPLKGYLTVQHAETPIKSIELQLIRVETCGSEEGYTKDATEIQTVQIADGNICPKLHVPIYIIFPRLFTCPTLITNNFKIEFEFNIVVIFKDDYIVSENFPLIFKRLCNKVTNY